MSHSVRYKKSVSFCRVQKQSLFLNESHSLTELRVICRIVGSGEEPTSKPHVLSHHDLLESVMKVQSGNTKMDGCVEGRNSESRAARSSVDRYRQQTVT